MLSTPAFSALKKKWAPCEIYVFCIQDTHQEVYRNNPNIDHVRNISFWSNPTHFILYYLKWAKFYMINYGQFTPSIYYRKSAMEIIADMLEVELDQKKVQLFLTEEEDRVGKEWISKYKNPVAIHYTSLTTKNQEWPMEYWNELVESLPEYTFIQLGLPTESMVKGAVYTGKKTIRESLAILKNCIGFVGVNSTFSHATTAFDVPGVVVFGPGGPDIWGHESNINIYKKRYCSPCVDMIYDYPCPYGKPCMREITVEEVRTALLTQLARRKKQLSADVHLSHNSEVWQGSYS